jgi:proteasome lid subunit RPN8/RPN11
MPSSDNNEIHVFDDPVIESMRQLLERNRTMTLQNEIARIEAEQASSNALIDRLLEDAELCAPMEMCGLLFPNNGYLRCLNTAPRPEQAFNIDHEEYHAACRWMSAPAWAIVHSHPGNGAAPSCKDCALMDAFELAKMDMAMVIVGLKPKEIRCFKKVGDLYELQWVYNEEQVVNR